MLTKSEAGEHSGSTAVCPAVPTLLLLVTDVVPAEFPALPEPNGGINPPPAPPPLLGPPDRKTLLVFLRFFHLARRFWNQTWKKFKKKKILNLAPNLKKKKKKSQTWKSNPQNMKMCLSVYIKVCFVKVSTFHTCYPPPLSSSSSSSRRHSCKWEFSHSCRDTQKRSHRRPTRFSFFLYTHLLSLCFLGMDRPRQMSHLSKKKKENPFVFFSFFCLMIFDYIRPLFF